MKYRVCVTAELFIDIEEASSEKEAIIAAKKIPLYNWIEDSRCDEVAYKRYTTDETDGF